MPGSFKSELQTLLKIYEFILGKNKEMLKAINKERRKNDEYKEQLPILIERLQHLSEACIKKEELIETQGEYMQQMESQIYELQTELSNKDRLIRDLNKTVLEQREYIDKQHTYDNSMSMSDNSRNEGRGSTRKLSTKEDYKQQHKEDNETIDGLKDDIKQLLKEYKLIEKQKDDIENKYDEV